MISMKLGLRNLFRNRWRSGLTLAAIAVAVGVMVWTLGFYEGWIDEMVRGATSVEVTQAQVHTAAYVEAPRSYRTFALDTAQLDSIRAVAGVVAVSPRAELNGLIGNEDRSQVARIVGVRPDLEAAATPIAEAVTDGRWLSDQPAPYPAPREAVIGEGVAHQLRVGVGAELVVFLEAADGSLGNELLRVVGIVRTGNTQVDRMGVYVHLSDAQNMGALGDGIHEIAIRASDLNRAPEVATAVASAIGALAGTPPDSAVERGQVAGDRLVVQPWQEIVPSINQIVILFRQSYWFMYLLIYLVAAIGILNTQRMSALERRREFGVLMAIGMRPRRMFRTLVVETAVLGTVGALIGALVGGLATWYFAAKGLDMGLLTSAGKASFSFMGVAFSDRLYFVLYPGAVIQPVAVMLIVAALCGLWPAIKAARIDPAPTIAGRT